MKNKDIKEYNRMMKEKIGDMPVLEKNEVVSKFYGIRLVSENEKEEYFEDKYKKIKIWCYIACIFCILFAIVITVFGKLVFAVILALLGCSILFIPLDDSAKNKIIQNSKLYLADCYIYRIMKKHDTDGYIDYYVQVTDKVSGYLEEEFYISNSWLKNNDGIIKAKLYVEEYNGKYDMYVN